MVPKRVSAAHGDSFEEPPATPGDILRGCDRDLPATVTAPEFSCAATVAGELPHTFEQNDRSLHFPPSIRHILEKLSESDRTQLFLYVLHGAGLREDA